MLRMEVKEPRREGTEKRIIPGGRETTSKLSKQERTWGLWQGQEGHTQSECQPWGSTLSGHWAPYPYLSPSPKLSPGAPSSHRSSQVTLHPPSLLRAHCLESKMGT